MRKFIALKTIGLLALLLSFGMVRGQSSVPTNQPKNAESAVTPQQEAEILRNKEAWIAAHPEDYQRLSGQQVVAPSQGTEMSAKEKEAYYASHPELNTRQSAVTTYPWGAPENKEAWVSTHPRQYQHMTEAHQDNRIVITRAEFNQLPAIKQQAISNDPKYNVVETPSTK